MADLTNPRVSLLLPNRDNGPVLDEFFEKLAENTTYEDVELIAADDGSSDESVPILRRWRDSGRFPRFTLLEREHRGIIATLDEMLEHVTGDVCIKIDGDATVETPGWIERMLGFMRTDERIGIVVAKVIFDSGRLHTYGVNVVCPEGIHDRGTRITEPVGRRSVLGDLERPFEHESEGGDDIAEVDAALSCWTMMRTDLVRELGGWDPAYYPVWYEDIDFAFAARTRDWKVFFFPEVRVIHHVGRRDPRVGRARWKHALFEANRRFGRFVPQAVKDRVATASRLGDRDPAKIEVLERHRRHWWDKWGFDPVNPDMDAIRSRYEATEVWWRFDDERRSAGEEIVRRYLETRRAPAAA